jgi:hypothetical protein
MINSSEIKNFQILKKNTLRLKKLFFTQSFDKVSLIIYCVDKSTIRAFHFSKGYVKTYKPLSIFRVWAYKFLSDSKNIKLIKSNHDFKQLRKIAIKDLQNFWAKEDGGQPEFYQFNKLIDLLFKCMPLWNELDNKTKEWIFKNTNVPLDKFSLDLLRRYNPKLNIPKNASMNFINSSNYNTIQKEIKKICKDTPVIVFDLYAWDESHRPKESFELIKIDFNKQLKNKPIIIL